MDEAHHSDIQAPIFGNNPVDEQSRTHEEVCRRNLLPVAHAITGIAYKCGRHKIDRIFLLLRSVTESPNHSFEIGLIGETNERRKKELINERGGSREDQPPHNTAVFTLVCNRYFRL